jgi:hypothetical protein
MKIGDDTTISVIVNIKASPVVVADLPSLAFTATYFISTNNAVDEQPIIVQALSFLDLICI